MNMTVSTWLIKIIDISITRSNYNPLVIIKLF